MKCIHGTWLDIDCRKCDEEENSKRSPVECGVMPLDDWIDEACPTLEIKLETHAREFGIEEKLIKGFVRCCMTDIRQDFDFEEVA